MARLRDAKNILSKLCPHIAGEEEIYNDDSDESDLQKWATKITGDLRTLEDELEELGKILEDLRGMVSYDAILSRPCYN
jgi:hypothetical protein